METLAAWSCCIDSKKAPALIGKLSPHSAGQHVIKAASVPACNNVVEISPASSAVKVQFGEISAVECGFSIGGLELPLWVVSHTLWFDANMIISTGGAKEATFTPLEFKANMLPCC